MKKIDRLEGVVFEIEGFWSADRCASIISDCEEQGFDEALVSTEQGAVRRDDVRNNERIIRDDPSLASSIWKDLEPFVPSPFKERNSVGLNERFRFYRYHVGQQFDWHQDGYFERENGERSQFTFMIYLNEGFAGGGTTFADVYSSLRFKDFTIEPKTGSALLFHHPLSHRGDVVTKGKKYALRSDVMYSPEQGA